MVLARLLAPEYFGILGMAMVFAGVIFVIQESGFSSYLIYKKNYNINVVSSTFWLNFIVSVCLALLLWILSPYISILYNDDQVGIVLKYVSVGILIGSFGNTSRAIIMKNNKLNFRTQ
ncbi:oligosaccharide flippase family protein [Caldifermentibacillus hisashii]|uniref:oligosaccharide flippase family protein n=1 Tax=Caldifermentibacillus hisashii TaxID=996558 RepID=UPI002E24CD65|nr:oligosaccharide flippase family protein [Caldifermentibacillus hisashii]